MFFREKISEKLKYLEISLNYLRSSKEHHLRGPPE